MTKKRNIGQELLEGVRAIKRGKGKRVSVNLPKDVRAIREKVGLSQSAFAARCRMAPSPEQPISWKRSMASGVSGASARP